ncbi:hypothetical protein Glove_315g68 [Diversispora epigaea]|uniref:Uncharacterized protein n=1 Tax=Diversispora epigaea TaxID=1348612 RepID=A0A397HR08_9GLOM|nr:hypothetical protein Glove_315g68 [Diversispora epigaea]
MLRLDKTFELPKGWALKLKLINKTHKISENDMAMELEKIAETGEIQQKTVEVWITC